LFREEFMIATGSPNIYIAAALRSGSTHIALSLCKLLGMRLGRVNGLHGEGVEEHVVNPFSAAILMPYGRFVFQQHTKGTPANKMYIKNFNNHLIVLTRNLPDSLVSLREWVTSEENPAIPGLVFPGNFKAWDEDSQYDWLIDNAVPWYIQFTYSWLDSTAYWIDYDEYYKDQTAGMQGILRHFGIPNSSSIREAVADKSLIRVGKPGRGRGLGLKDRIHELIDRWHPYDKVIKEKLL
jgi:GNAT superfamily N-acetyltransferase